MALRLPDIPYERPSNTGTDGANNPRQLVQWREQIHRMFDYVGTVTGTPGLIAVASSGTLTVSVLGCFADQAQTVEVGAPSTVDAGLIWVGYVSANDTVTIRIWNTTALDITPASATWSCRVTP